MSILKEISSKILWKEKVDYKEKVEDKIPNYK